MSCHALLQGIFPTQGSNPCLPHCRWILYHLSHQGNPRILEWIDYTLSRGSSWPRSWTGVSRIAGGFFTSLAIRETHLLQYIYIWLSTKIHKIYQKTRKGTVWRHKAVIQARIIYDTILEVSNRDFKVAN